MESEINEDLREFVLNYTEPAVFKSFLNWDLLSWDLNKWNQHIGSEPIRYRIGKRKYTKVPQWENKCEYKNGTFKDFLKHFQSNPDQFAYYDYKHLVENFQNVTDLRKSISWQTFGFPDYDSDKSTLWIGSEGAHTPCHKDTYGCNLVAQIYGKKRWVLFPPDEDLFPTRVPYEESSIFSKLNFYNPRVKSFKDVNNCKIVVLSPGDVLLVPHGWWHYVENLEMAISVNVWLEKEEDVIGQLNESLIQFFMSCVFSGMNDSQKNSLINPTTFTEELSIEKSLQILNICRKNYIRGRNIEKKSVDFEKVLEKYKGKIELVRDLSKSEFIEFLTSQSGRFPVSDDSEKGSEDDNLMCDVLNAFTNESVIKLVKDNLLRFYSDKLAE